MSNFEDEGSTLWDLQSFSYNDVFDGERNALISLHLVRPEW